MLAAMHLSNKQTSKQTSNNDLLEQYGGTKNIII